MADDKEVKKEVKIVHKYHHDGGGSGALYGFGVIGAAFYFLPQAHNLSEGLIAIIKAVAWPGLIVFRILELLKF